MRRGTILPAHVRGYFGDGVPRQAQGASHVVPHLKALNPVSPHRYKQFQVIGGMRCLLVVALL